MPIQQILTACAIAALTVTAVLAQAAPGQASSRAEINFEAPATDQYAAEIREGAVAAKAEIESFFGAPFPDPIHFKLVANREDFDKALAKFDIRQSQCWMVGMGTADLIVVLSPQAWAKQACEHAVTDKEATRRLVAHELIHVYHGQFNASRDFTGMDDLDWFVEGVAVFGSGQLTSQRLKEARDAEALGQAPVSLSKVWTGPNRYGFAGSLVQYIDSRWGRATTIRLLKVQTTAEALTLLGTNEDTLVNGWRTSLQGQTPKR
jgi:hypothetical protein